MATQLELFSSPRVVHVRLVAQSIWKNSWFGWLMIGAFVLWYAWWCFHVPSPAKAATVLAVIAAIMAYRGEPEGFEKLFWTIVLFAFLFMELKAIDHKESSDEIQRSAARTQEAKNFETIGEGISAQISQSQQAFSATMTSMKGLLNESREHFGTTIEAVTGGDGMCFLYFSINEWNKSILVNASTPGNQFALHSVKADMFNFARQKEVKLSGGTKEQFDTYMRTLTAARQEVSWNIGDIPSGLWTGKEVAILPFDGRDAQGFNVTFEASNGKWDEFFRGRRTAQGKWIYALRLEGPYTVSKKGEKTGPYKDKSFEIIDPDYPKKDGKVDWED